MLAIINLTTGFFCITKHLELCFTAVKQKQHNAFIHIHYANNYFYNEKTGGF